MEFTVETTAAIYWVGAIGGWLVWLVWEMKPRAGWPTKTAQFARFCARKFFVFSKPLRKISARVRGFRADLNRWRSMK